MVVKIADNIISPLGEETQDVVNAVLNGQSKLRQERLWYLPEPVVASRFEVTPEFVDLVERSVSKALQQVNKTCCAEDGKTVFILATTKGDMQEPFGKAAGDIAEWMMQEYGSILGKVTPLTVSQACISGLSAQILAQRLLAMGCYDLAVVTGCDVLTPFIVSGFQSLKATSNAECRPFDIDRNGLNLGEAVATMVLGNSGTPDLVNSGTEDLNWVLEAGSVHNDAFHISGPSKEAKGSYLSLQDVVISEDQTLSSVMPQKVPPLACISVHGTATLYNDDMESKAIDRNGLNEVPVSALKGYFGHTMGAAGVLETIVTMNALEQGVIPATRGFAEAGTSKNVNVVKEKQPVEVSDGMTFVKLMSGFGGCNAAMRYSLSSKAGKSIGEVPALREVAKVCLKTNKADLTRTFKSMEIDYPKFYKMDVLCRLGFVASEQLLREVNKVFSEQVVDDNTAVLLVGKSASAVADHKYEETIQPGEDNYFPSPADFVYTLPNIVTGEIAIRHGLNGESWYIALPERDDAVIEQMAESLFAGSKTKSAIVGWIECPDEEHLEAELRYWTI